MIRGLFVTGTDTGVGKTWIAGGLLRRLRAAGVGAVPMKPVQTGAVRDGGGGLRAPDLEATLAAAGLAVAGADRDDDHAPYRFEPACSPHLAARLEGRAIDLDRIVAAAARLSARHGAVVVEGAGGVLVPLGPGASMLDLAARLALPAVVVARAGVGTLNHALLTLEALRRAGVAVGGVVLNEAEPGPRAPEWVRDDNARTIAERGGAPVLARVPPCDGLAALDAALAGVDAAALVGSGAPASRRTGP